jgi:hypothetical protein
MVGSDEVAFIIGSGASRQIAIASITDGRFQNLTHLHQVFNLKDSSVHDRTLFPA